MLRSVRPLRSGQCQRSCVFFFQAEDGIRDLIVTGVQTCALPISPAPAMMSRTRMKTYFIGASSPPGASRLHLLGAGGGEIGRARVGKECRSRWSPYH